MVHADRWLPALVIACAMTVAGGCGKKGNPLPPFARVPAAISTIAATRLGSDVYVTLTVPATNIDGSIPVSISRIIVYAYTGSTPPILPRFAELADVVATIPVTPPPPGPMMDAPTPGPVPAPAPVPAAAAAVAAFEALPGLPVTIRDALTGDELVQGRQLIDPRRKPAPAAAIVPVPAGALRRFYLAVAFGERGQPGPPGTLADVTLTALPEPPPAVTAAYTELGMTVAWEPSGGLLGFLLDRSLPAEPPPFDVPALAVAAPAIVDPGVPPGPTLYNVYRELAPDPLALPPPSAPPDWSVALPAAINPAPLAATFTTDLVEFGREHCYMVRAVRGTLPIVTSEPSPRTCVIPVDIFPPVAPVGLTAVPSEGAISLIWEPGSDPDLGGYLVLRREVGDATLRLLTDTPVVDARFRDTEVKPGTRYIYSVVAVDSQLPLPNVSAESVPVEETAR